MSHYVKNNIVLDKFIKNISKLQQINNSKVFTIYDRMYRNFFQRFFRLSSVSIIFRLSLNKENLFQKSSSRSGIEGCIEHLDKTLKEKIYFFEILLKDQIIKSNIESNINYDGNLVFNINDFLSIIETVKANKLTNYEKDIPVKKELSKNENNKKTNEICQDLFFEEIINNLEIEVLFIKRAKSKRDRYSGNIAFPGGRSEKEDITTFNTSVRETLEEIGINLLNNHVLDVNGEKNGSSSFLPMYLGPNIGFDVTIDMKNFVSSHIFLIVDFNRDLEKKFILSDNEIAEVIFVPLKFFHELDVLENNQKANVDENKIYTYVDGIVAGRKCKVKNIILKNDTNFLLYGMTLRKIINFLNIDSHNIKYNDDIIFESNILNFYYKLVLYLLNFLNNSSNTLRLFKRLIGLLAVTLFGNVIFKEIQNIKKGKAKF